MKCPTTLIYLSPPPELTKVIISHFPLRVRNFEFLLHLEAQTVSGNFKINEGQVTFMIKTRNVRSQAISQQYSYGKKDTHLYDINTMGMCHFRRAKPIFEKC